MVAGFFLSPIKKGHGLFYSRVPRSKLQQSPIRYHGTIATASFIRSEYHLHLHSHTNSLLEAMLLSCLLAFLTGFSLTGAATFQFILDGPGPTDCETPPTTTSVVPTATSVPQPPSLPPLVPTPEPTGPGSPGSPNPSSCPHLESSLCPPSGTLGIRYGRCYTMTDIAGRQFTRPTVADYLPFYYIGGIATIRNIPFRVCGNSTRCNLFQDEYVPEAGKWYLQDQAGSADLPSSDFVGINPGGGGRWWFIKTESGSGKDEAQYKTSFTAKTRCFFGKCTPCVRLYNNTSSSPVGRLGIIPATLTGGDAPFGEALLLAGNNNTCLPIIFQETTCLSLL